MVINGIINFLLVIGHSTVINERPLSGLFINSLIIFHLLLPKKIIWYTNILLMLFHWDITLRSGEMTGKLKTKIT